MSRRERGGAQEAIPKPVPERRLLIQCSKKRGRQALNKGHGRAPDDRVAQVEALTQGPVYTMSPLNAAMQVHQDTQSHQCWEPVWIRLSLEAPLELLLEAPSPSRDAEQGSDLTCTHTMVLAPTLQAPKLLTPWCPTQSQLHTPPSCHPRRPQALRGQSSPAPPAVLTVLAVHPIVPRRALADVVSEDIAPVWDQLALTIVVARIGVAGPWGRGKTTVIQAQVENKSIQWASTPHRHCIPPSASSHHITTQISAPSAIKASGAGPGQGHINSQQGS